MEDEDNDICDDESCEDDEEESVIDKQFEIDKTTGKKVRKAKKVIIEIYDKDPHFDNKECRFSEGAGENDELSGKPYTHVGFGASYYGYGAPCTSEEEIQSSIEHSKVVDY